MQQGRSMQPPSSQSSQGIKVPTAQHGYQFHQPSPAPHFQPLSRPTHSSPALHHMHQHRPTPMIPLSTPSTSSTNHSTSLHSSSESLSRSHEDEHYPQPFSQSHQHQQHHLYRHDESGPILNTPPSAERTPPSGRSNPPSQPINQRLEPIDRADRPHLVFQCKNCRALVGDSFSYASGSDKYKIIGLKSVLRVSTTGREPQIARDGYDRGSTFFPFICDQCQCQLGRYYASTSSELDDFRDLWCFNQNCITSYALGTASASESAEIEDQLPTCSSLESEVRYVQFVMSRQMDTVEKLTSNTQHLESLVQQLTKKVNTLTSAMIEFEGALRTKDEQLKILQAEKALVKVEKNKSPATNGSASGTNSSQKKASTKTNSGSQSKSSQKRPRQDDDETQNRTKKSKRSTQR